MTREESSMPSSLADMAALGKLFEEHGPKLLAMVQRRLDPALAPRIGPEEILNEAFFDARRKWHNFKNNSAMTPYAWLYRIVMDRLIEVWRHENRDCRDRDREMHWPERSSIQLGLGLVNPGTSPSEAAARAELQERMRQTLQLLGARDQEILWMRHYDELSFKEAALVLGLTESAATLRYVRALRRLKNHWQQLHDKGDNDEPSSIGSEPG
jgi:RNA polymerase sigma-70 factor (ECF subfamily)